MGDTAKLATMLRSRIRVDETGDYVTPFDKALDDAASIITGCNKAASEDIAKIAAHCDKHERSGRAQFSVAGIRSLLAALTASPVTEDDLHSVAIAAVDAHAARLEERERCGKLADRYVNYTGEELPRLIRSAALAPSQGVALRDIAAERKRQIDAEGWTPKHDDTHAQGQLAYAAACYALTPLFARPVAWSDMFTRLWPWDEKWWKPTDRRRDLIKAGALITAEIERLDRAAAPEQEKSNG